MVDERVFCMIGGLSVVVWVAGAAEGNNGGDNDLEIAEITGTTTGGGGGGRGLLADFAVSCSLTAESVTSLFSSAGAAKVFGGGGDAGPTATGNDSSRCTGGGTGAFLGLSTGLIAGGSDTGRAITGGGGGARC